ncbi:MAG: MarR family transcriptional regulator [Clostridiales bacterium]|nr:MarR family transcriptional regulator [Clostridiales bacterium]
MSIAFPTHIAVVGGCNFDIYATPYQPLISADSNPGSVFTTPGGVGRNIAENLARLGVQTKMLTALGRDAFGDAIIQQAQEVGLDLSHALRLPHLSTSVYMCINQNDGDIAVAVSDMKICDQIAPAYLQQYGQILQDASLVVADANLTQDTLLFLSQHYGNKLCIDCVSTPKAERVKACLKDLFCLKANRTEAAVVSGVDIHTDDDVAMAAEVLHRKGVQRVIITLGGSGAYVSAAEEAYTMPLMPGDTLNTSGCGDAFFAGALLALTEKQNVTEVLRHGLAMARICAASQSAVSQTVNRQQLTDTLQQYQGGAWK